MALDTAIAALAAAQALLGLASATGFTLAAARKLVRSKCNYPSLCSEFALSIEQLCCRLRIHKVSVAEAAVRCAVFVFMTTFSSQSLRF
jgi:hypothetical protein